MSGSTRPTNADLSRKGSIVKKVNIKKYAEKATHSGTRFFSPNIERNIEIKWTRGKEKE